MHACRAQLMSTPASQHTVHCVGAFIHFFFNCVTPIAQGRLTEHGTVLTLSSERSQHDCAVAKKSNTERISAICYTACPRNGVLQSSDDTLCNFARGLSPHTSLGACEADHIGTLLHCLSTNWWSAVF